MKKALLKIKTLFYYAIEFFEWILNLILSIISFILPRKEMKKDFQILIVPGLFGSRFFYRKIQNRIEKEGLKVEIAPLSEFGLSVNSQVKRLSEILKQSPSKLTVIAHNTGGLFTMVLPDESRQKIDTFITLGTPFYGSYLFHFTSMLGFFSDWKYKSEYLQNILNNALLFNYFYPFSPISDITFPPKKSAEFGQGRDWWFDIPGNFNLVRRNENLRTLMEFLKSTPSFKSIFDQPTPAHRTKEIAPKKAPKQIKATKKTNSKKSKPLPKKTIKNAVSKKKTVKAKKRKLK